MRRSGSKAASLFGVVAVAAALLAVAPGSTAGAAPRTFEPVTPTGSSLFVTDAATDFWVNSVAPADVDGDGDLDLAVIGFYVVYFEDVEHILVIFENDGPDGTGGWSFTEQRVPLGDVAAGSSDLAWGDYDGDGDPDLAVGSEGATLLYANDGGTLSLVPTALPGYSEDSGYTGAYDLRSISWADADNDGDVDLLVPSVYDSEAGYSTKLLRNDGADGAGGWTFNDMSAGLVPTVHAQSAWADDDGDGDVDLLLANVDPYTETGFVERFGNDHGTFTGQTLVDSTVEYGSADWGDPDADGDLDVLVAGLVHEPDDTFATVLRVYYNDAGTYTPIDVVDPDSSPWLDIHAATWADYDSDGDMDLLATGNYIGESEIVGRSVIYDNEGGQFVPTGVSLPAPVQSVGRGGAFTWFDLDGDGDLDYLVAGAYYVPDGAGLVEAQMNLFRNDAPAPNQQPSAPAVVSAIAKGGTAHLHWSPSADDSTAVSTLTYDVQLVRDTGGTADDSARGSGGRRAPEPGNVGSATSFDLRGLAPGTYTWTVRAVDSAFNASPAIRGRVTVPGPAPGDSPGLTIAASTARPPVVVPVAGGAFRYDTRVLNWSNVRRTLDVWALVTRPDGTMRTGEPVRQTLAPGEAWTRSWTVSVPSNWPAGDYVVRVMVGTYPAPVASDTFNWSKAAS